MDWDIRGRGSNFLGFCRWEGTISILNTLFATFPEPEPRMGLPQSQP